jgi:DNA-binding transcriptional MerR regulator
MIPTLATAAQLAEIFNVTERTVRNWINDGLTPVGTYTEPTGRTHNLYRPDHITTGNK